MSIGIERGKEFIEVLYTNATLTNLDLSFNQITSGELHALSKALHKNITITYLNLYAMLNILVLHNIFF
ncbi:hypothetical protein C2G38_2235605 [Gigaspora rosea]|uniref:Uncharacterized protein n=1 Tax=Gigaspora rosea TaxID=44941 RepID=A0A397TQ56_9GLOM|nr:hypothetical protein C2G38_2235605 [Gigaspora rosea]